MAEIPIPPPWLANGAPPRRKPGFQPGQSGNPGGRRPGSRNKKTLLSLRLSQELQDAASAVQAAVISKALEGDTTAQSIVMARISPPLRGRAERVTFNLDPDALIAEQAKQVIVAVSRGEIDIDTAKSLLDMLSAFVGLKDIEGFLTELKELRNELPSGGVWTYDVQQA